MKKVVLAMIVAVALVGCTANQRAKKFGGSSSIVLPAGKKLVTATWKGDNLWLLTRERKDSEPIQAYTFKEDSKWGILQGSVSIKEN